MFQFPTFALLQLSFSQLGFPIRTSTAQCLLAAPRSFSQLATSFFACTHLGIPRLHFLCSSFLFFLLQRCQITSFPSLSLPFVEDNGIEPMTSCLQGRRSSQLS